MSFKRRLAALFLCALFVSGAAAEASAQYRYRVRVWHPRNYARTRQTMTDRAALRGALKRKRERRALRARSAARRHAPRS